MGVTHTYRYIKVPANPLAHTLADFTLVATKTELPQNQTYVDVSCTSVSGYKSLTVDNFLVIVKKVGSYEYSTALYASYSSSYSPSATYTASSGVFRYTYGNNHAFVISFDLYVMQ